MVARCRKGTYFPTEDKFSANYPSCQYFLTLHAGLYQLLLNMHFYKDNIAVVQSKSLIIMETYIHYTYTHINYNSVKPHKIWLSLLPISKRSTWTHNYQKHQYEGKTYIKRNFVCKTDQLASNLFHKCIYTLRKIGK